jgi:hypothetical protein
MTYRYEAPSFSSHLNQERPRCWGKEYATDNRECRACSFNNSCRDQIIRSNINRPSLYQQAQHTVPTNNTIPHVPYRTAYPAQTYATPQPVPTVPVQPAPTFTPPTIPLQQPTYQHVQPPPRYQPPQPQPQQAQPAQPQQQQAQQPQPTQNSYPYGWLQDPLYWQISATPSPVRPQLPGETYFQRVSKNMVLALAEAFFAQGLLAMRQLVLPPKTGRN